MLLTPENVFRRYNTDGVPDSGAHDPKKDEIIQLLNQLFGVSRGGWVVAKTVAELNGVTPESETDGGVVLTGDGAGYYDRESGAWVFGRGFPDTFARVLLSGTGTAQSGVLAAGVAPAGIEVFFAKVAVPNTGALTLSINSGTVRQVVNLAGNPLSAGEWTGMVMFYLNDDGQYQLLLDAGAAAAAAQSASDANNAANRAESWTPEYAASTLSQTKDYRDQALDARNEAVGSANDAAQEVVVAEAAANRAETAETGAMLAAASVGFFSSTSAGIAGTTNGQVFWTVEGDTVVYYQNVSAVAVPVPGARVQNADLSRKNGSASVDAEREEVVIGGTSRTGSITSYTNCYGYKITVDGVLTRAVVNLSATGAGNLLVVRPKGDGTLIIAAKQSFTAIPGATAAELPVQPVKVFAGDFIMYQAVSGGYLGSGPNSGVAYSATPGNGVGDAVAYGAVASAKIALLLYIQHHALFSELTSNQQASGVALGPVDERGDLSGANAGTLALVLAAEPTPYDGFIEYVKIDLSAAADFLLKFLTPNGDGSYTVERSVPVTGAVVGLNTIDLRRERIFLPTGSLVCHDPAGLSSRPKNRPAVGETVRYFPTSNSVDIEKKIATPTITTSGTLAAIAYGIAGVSVGLSQRVDDLDVRVAAIEAHGITAGSTVIESTRFPGASLPAAWTQNGGWTVANGLIAPATGGWGVYALSDKQSSLSNRKIIARIKAGASNSVFGICAKPPENSGGLVAMVDGANNQLRLYSWDGTTTPGGYATYAALPAALIADRAYTLEVEKKGLTVDVTLTDTVTHASVTISETQGGGYRQMHGQPGFMQLSGSSVTVDSFDHIALYDEDAHAVIIGDSNAEGNHLATPTWAYQLASLRNRGDIVIAARAGDETPNFIAREPIDLLMWKPRYVVLALGTNDTDQAVWRTNVAQIIDDAEALGAEVILTTQPPRTGDQALRTAMNVDIRSGYFGRYRYIDFASALSAGNDGVTWNAAFNSGDGVHPNAAGQSTMLAQLRADAPFLVG